MMQRPVGERACLLLTSMLFVAAANAEQAKTIEP